MHFYPSKTYKITASINVFNNISPDADHTKLSIYPGASNIKVLLSGINLVTLFNFATNKFNAVRIAPLGPNFSLINY